MSAASRMNNSLLSATNENNLQLASFNFDFSLLKFEAPPEFQRLGSMLSTNRRKDAEEGPSHVTARRLGALFEEVIPRTPLLVKAFGNRISEVVETPGINPKGSPLHGPFEKYVGADGTALWAAATSGFASIGVCLLACLLARTWDAKHATALWVELVKQRQLEIERAFEETSLVSTAALFSARQQISRDDLAQWDNSARAWLRSADRAKPFEITQLSLIQRNIHLPLPSNSTTYANILHVWKQAMQGVEALLSGTPLLITDGTFLLAFSSWYLFPDLIVLGSEMKNVCFRDKLFPPGGKGTIGIETTTPNLTGEIQWSLVFSHLKFYGDPVLARNNRDFSRVTFEELKLVVLGSLFGCWRVSIRDHSLIAQWFVNIGSLLSKLPGIRESLSWLMHLVDGAHALLSTDTHQREINSQLAQYGQRRAKSFLTDQVIAPFFGLSNPLTIRGLTQHTDKDCGIEYLRCMATAMGLKNTSAFICYLPGQTNTHVEVMTAVPHVQLSRKRGAGGENVSHPVHVRWLLASPDDSESSRTVELAELVSRTCSEKGEQFLSLKVEFRFESNESFRWPDPPTPFERNDEHHTCALYNLVFGHKRLGLYIGVPFRNDPRPLQAEAQTLASQNPSPRKGLQMITQATLSPTLLAWYFGCLIDVGIQEEPDTASKKYNRRSLYRNHLPGVDLCTASFEYPVNLCKSLFAFDLAAGVYQNLTKATIPLTLVNKPLHECLWLPSPFYRKTSTEEIKHGNLFSNNRVPFIPARPQPLDLTQAFSCIARLENGTSDVDPADLESAFALASGDSIFVAAVVLSDPFDSPAPHDIRHIVGNIGRPGLSILVAPQDPNIRKPTDSFNTISHLPYDFHRVDNFQATSLHLSFTEWKFPLYVDEERTIDQDVMMVESVISVLDRGKWVADLDIRCIDFEQLSRITIACSGHRGETIFPPEPPLDDSDHDDYFSVDNWDELLDAPEGVGIVRAHGNWAARLAAVSILYQKGQGHSIGVFGPDKVCFRCFRKESLIDMDLLEEHEAPLPSFCID
ncbi:hypothetical protein ASPBRDRAFT_209089 [Aspergillus brasiliensis CBS 101740]|uniref:Uncharacterized protein n=1 Tax=Aspergillus brasiliensis (strain CBS 101740 / IMI 381727 / IBT 21946) TaxID=767769 RepID=A0A1L9UCZ5_ASPBC|nr:hypothetical protein ASPBRDRAFT_209089 [Aspergillus brasiliensis CBS 101740]